MKKSQTKKEKQAESIKKIDDVVQLKQIEEEKKVEENNKETIENGTGLIIMLSGDILMGGFLFKKKIAYKVNKQQFVELEKHTRILGVAMQIL